MHLHCQADEGLMEVTDSLIFYRSDLLGRHWSYHHLSADIRAEQSSYCHRSAKGRQQVSFFLPFFLCFMVVLGKNWKTPGTKLSNVILHVISLSLFPTGRLVASWQHCSIPSSPSCFWLSVLHTGLLQRCIQISIPFECWTKLNTF